MVKVWMLLLEEMMTQPGDNGGRVLECLRLIGDVITVQICIHWVWAEAPNSAFGTNSEGVRWSFPVLATVLHLVSQT